MNESKIETQMLNDSSQPLLHKADVMRSAVFNEDCIAGMKRYPDKFFHLAIVDPPYGIGVDGAIHIRKPDRPSTWDMVEKYERKEWDTAIPTAEYWN